MEYREPKLSPISHAEMLRIRGKIERAISGAVKGKVVETEIGFTKDGAISCHVCVEYGETILQIDLLSLDKRDWYGN